MKDFTDNLKFKKKLNLPSNVTFGVEIEFELAHLDKVSDCLDTAIINHLLDGSWCLKQDDSLYYTLNSFKGFGGELVSPILRDNMFAYKQIRNACHIIKKCEGAALEKCGAHIHIGSNILKNNVKYYIRLAKLWTIYEDIIMRFSAGEEDDIREGAYQYAKSSAQVLRHIDYFEKGKEVSCDFETFVRLFGSQKKMAISFFNLHKNRPFHTIEVRCPNGTINPLIWENNINFFTKLLLATTNNKKDWDLINYLYQESKNNCREDYEFNIDKATDLVDFVFDDEIDKNDFMIQYEKRNEKVLKLKR